MKRLRFIFLMLLILPVALQAQYTGGSGKGCTSSGVNDNFAGNFFKTNGNWSTTANWSEGALPVSTASANVAAIAVVDGDFSYPSMTIASVGSATISPTKSLTVTGTLTNNNGNAGLVIESDGSLIHNTNNVSATVKRTITGSSNLLLQKYHFISIPTQYTAPTSSLFLGSYLYYLDPTELNENGDFGKWIGLGELTNTPLFTNKGYMIYYPGASKEYSFTGNLNNGTYTYALEGHESKGSEIFTFNLIPNPYPSAIVWNTGDASWSTSVGIGGVCYIWNNGNYANISSGALSYIPVGQALMVAVLNEASPTLSVNNAARTHSNQAFYKSGGIENQLTVKVTANDYDDETVVKFTEEATEDFDLQIDGLKINGLEEAPQLFTLSGDTKYSINNLPVLKDQRIVDLNFETQFSGQICFNISGIDSFDPTLNIYLKDELINQTINLRNQQVYSFMHNPENAANRFKLVFGGTIGIDEPFTAINKIWFAGNDLCIKAPELTGQTALVEIYNIAGQRLLAKSVTLDGLTSLSLNLSGPMIAKVTANGNVLNAKGILMK
jgi:hypothetical protein